MKFCILTRPRSGSHMLASALDKHPALEVHGEYGMEKYPRLMGDVEKDHQGWIVQDFMLKHDTARLDDFDKIILLVRDLSKRMEYRGVHFFAPTEIDQSIRDHGQEDPGYMNLVEMCQGRDYMIINYDDLTRGKDIREIPKRYAEILCMFLGVEYHPLNPLFHKPVVNAAR